ncbi:MAG: hypothetical protein OYL41_06795, partial [Acidobacteriota bacterium]|nr:hypothetical protein [Acidobacteriota bacterium]
MQPTDLLRTPAIMRRLSTADCADETACHRHRQKSHIWWTGPIQPFTAVKADAQAACLAPTSGDRV